MWDLSQVISAGWGVSTEKFQLFSRMHFPGPGFVPPCRTLCSPRPPVTFVPQFQGKGKLSLQIKHK